MHRFFLFALIMGSLTPIAAHAQQAIPALGNRDAAFVAATPHFRFHSNFWLNLHDYLYGLAAGGPGDEYLEPEATACFEALPAAQAEAWSAAVAFYASAMAPRHHRRDPLMRAVRYRLAGLATEAVLDPEMDGVIARLREIAPAYRACLWDAHDARNRARIADLLGHAVRYGPALADRLGRLYDAGWPEDVVVDVVSYSNFAGANTSGGRVPHTMLSSIVPDVSGFSGLEILFHEASHIVFGSSRGAVAAALNGAAETLDVETPRSLWHAVSFHTSGRAVQAIAAAEGVAYEPYWLRNNVFSEYHGAVTAHWEAYLEGEATMDEAALDLVRAVRAE